MDAVIRFDVDIRQAPDSGSPSEPIAASNPPSGQRDPRLGGRKGPDSGTGRTNSWKTGTRAVTTPSGERASSLPDRTRVNNHLAIDADVGDGALPPSDRAASSRQHSSQQHRMPRRPARKAIAGAAMALVGGRTPGERGRAPGLRSNGISRRVDSSSHRKALPATRMRRKVSERHKAKTSGTRPIDEAPRMTGAGPTRPMPMRQKQPGPSNAEAGPRINVPPHGIAPRRSNGRDGPFGGRGGTNRLRTAWSQPGIRISGLAGRAAPAAT